MKIPCKVKEIYKTEPNYGSNFNFVMKVVDHANTQSLHRISDVDALKYGIGDNILCDCYWENNQYRIVPELEKV